MQVDRIAADGHDQDHGEGEHAGRELVDPARRRLLRHRRPFDAGEIQQVIVGRPLVRIVQDLVGAHDLPEPQRRLRIAGIDIGMGTFDGSAKR